MSHKVDAYGDLPPAERYRTEDGAMVDTFGDAEPVELWEVACTYADTICTVCGQADPVPEATDLVERVLSSAGGFLADGTRASFTVHREPSEPATIWFEVRADTGTARSFILTIESGE